MILKAALLAICATAFCSDALAQTDEDVIIEGLTLQIAREIVEANGGAVEASRVTDEGFEVKARFEGMGLKVLGMACSGAGDGKVCPEYLFETWFDAGDEARARTMEHQLSTNFLSDHSDGSDVKVWRMGFTYGGVTRKHIQNVLGITVQITREAWDEIEGEKNGARAPSK